MQKGAKRLLLNSLRLWKGLYLGSPRLILSRLLWEQPQTLLGFLAAHGTNLFRQVDDIVFRDGTVILEGSGHKGSISLGTYMLLYPGRGTAKDNFLWRHEFGHTLQSRMSGPLYLFKYGIPSLLTDNDAWMERDANLRAALYFEKTESLPLSAWAGSRSRTMLPVEVQPKWYEYVLLFAGIGLVLLPWLNKNRPL